MASSEICLVLTLAYILHLAQSQILPTTTNATGTFYVASDYYNSGSYYYKENITCTGSYCHIACDIEYGCSRLNVNATSSSTILVVECLRASACYQTVINANTANSVQLSCTYDGTCSNLKLHASNVVNDVSIACVGEQACFNSDFNASNVGNSVTMTCDGHWACERSDVYCPKDAFCNIDCLADSSIIEAGCFWIYIHIATHSAEKINLDCSNEPEKACDYTRFVCEDTQLSDSLIISDSGLDCLNDDCCPLALIRGNISCAGGKLCEIDCDSQNCNSNIIDASSATSLSLDCGANGCKHATIYCPFVASASCDIKCHESKSCAYVTVNTDTNNMQELTIECYSSQSCQYLDLQLNSVQITKVAINCNSTSSCEYMNLQFNGSEINNLQLVCAGSQSCYSSTIKSIIASISHLDIICADTNSCSNMQLEAVISGNSNIYCGAKEACSSTDIDLVSTEPDVNLNITCAYLDLSNNFEESGACKEANINIYGYNNGSKTNNVSYVCDTFDCADATLNVYDVYWIDGECNDLSACEYSLNATTSQHLAVTCSGYKGCYNTHVLCPIEGSCDFDCLGLDACNRMKVEITNNSDEFYVNCIDSFYGCDYDEIVIYCMDSFQYGKLLWSSYYESMSCYGFCCPPHYSQAINNNDDEVYSSTRDPSSYAVNNTPYASDHVYNTDSSSKQITEAPSSTLSDTIAISSTKAKGSENKMRISLAMIVYVLSVILLVVVFAVVIYFKRTNTKIKKLHLFVEYLQNNNNNNGNIEMINTSNANPKQVMRCKSVSADYDTGVETIVIKPKGAIVRAELQEEQDRDSSDGESMYDKMQHETTGGTMVSNKLAAEGQTRD